SSDSLFQALILDNGNIKGNSYLYGPVKPQTKYFWRVANITNGEDIPYSSEKSFLTSVPNRFSLVQNYPNPFNPATTIRFTVPYSSLIKIKVYNALGQLTEVLIDKKLEAGGYEYTWNGSDYSSGVYLIRLEADNYIETKKMILLK
ncbi:MAG: T9SS type A sorting domain-containing protein, partial [Ignavibacteriales bacterium]